MVGNERKRISSGTLNLSEGRSVNVQRLEVTVVLGPDPHPKVKEWKKLKIESQQVWSRKGTWLFVGTTTMDLPDGEVIRIADLILELAAMVR